MTDLLSLLRPAEDVPRRYEHQVFLSNLLSVIFSLVALGILGIFNSLFGWMSSFWYLILATGLFLLVPVLNNRVSDRIGRVLFCLAPGVLTMVITISFKLGDTSALTYITYFDSRFILVGSVILPVVVFRLEERWQLLLCLGITSLLVFFFDPLHELFQVGFYQRGFSDPSYYYINYIVGVIYSLLLFCMLLLRSVLERSEHEMFRRNSDLIEKQNEIEAQHEELLQQQEEMQTGSEKLEQANVLITRQQSALTKYNEALEALVEEKSYELLKTNEELIKHNNELLQFSYTVSHNLRGPVARMLGLTRLLQRSEFISEREGLQDMILKSSEELDEILKDLSLIIDIRNDLYRVREKVFLEEEWSKAASLLGENVKSVYCLTVDFSDAPYIFSVRPMIQSIFYNLFSNAIKYQSPDRKLQIKVTSTRIDDNRTVITVSDNGLGIDLKSQQRNLFKLYKRFHTHVTGKGLGLYLVKTQVDTLGGTIELVSEPDRGTTFNLIFPEPEEISKQIFFENDAVQLSFDANHNILLIQWKRFTSGKEFRDAFGALLNSMNIYQSPGWISDLRKQGPVSDEDQRWFIDNVVPELVQCGLKRTALVGIDLPEKVNYYQRARAAAIVFGFEIKAFESFEDAVAWVGELQEADSRI